MKINKFGLNLLISNKTMKHYKETEKFQFA